jgi:sugar/nucleoside kinase (ribokinase family)
MPEIGITPPQKKLIVSIGSALVDILIREDDTFLSKTCVPKGGMILVDHEYIQQTLLQATDTPHIVPGGSACNTAIGIARLGGNARFVGKLGTDDLGRLFRAGLQKNQVESILFRSHLPTGRVLSVITPDAQRSMMTYLGASAETLPEELSNTSLTAAAIVHIEGYLLFNRNLIMAALKSAKKAGAMISLDLASFTVVRDSKKFLNEIVPEYVDILIANEDEAFAFTGMDDERRALKKLAEKTTIAVLKAGKRGSFIFHDNQIIPIAPIGTGNAVDTTGAGDLWASGFLFGLVHSFPLEKCGALGSACGYEVCQVVGAAIPAAGWKRIKKLFAGNHYNVYHS